MSALEPYTSHRGYYPVPSAPPMHIDEPDVTRLGLTQDPVERVQRLRIYTRQRLASVRATLNRRKDGWEEKAGNEEWLSGGEAVLDQLACLLHSLEDAMRSRRGRDVKP